MFFQFDGFVLYGTVRKGVLGLIMGIFWATLVSCTSLLSCSAENTGAAPETQTNDKEGKLSNNRLNKSSSLVSLLKAALLKKAQRILAEILALFSKHRQPAEKHKKMF